jgi:thiol-disulfide isomerase/thioredoxin
MKYALLLGLCMVVVACQQAAAPPNADVHPGGVGESDIQPTLLDGPYEFKGISQWFNTDGKALTRSELKGNVVLVDFWTYSCINCIRTLPYLTSWDEKYRDEGLVIVGIHSPEFAFEKKPQNVAAALTQYNIHYPVGLDNDYETWKEYENRWWPHTYLFDREGNLVFDHIGEGGYDEIEEKIQELLAVNSSVTEVASPDYTRINSPEIYLGGTTNRGNTAYDLALGEHVFPQPDIRAVNTVYLGGSWNVQPESILALNASTLALVFSSKTVYVVAAGEGSITAAVDNTTREVPVTGDNLYELADTQYGTHTLVLYASPGVELYAFTFG